MRPAFEEGLDPEAPLTRASIPLPESPEGVCYPQTSLDLVTLLCPRERRMDVPHLPFQAHVQLRLLPPNQCGGSGVRQLTDRVEVTLSDGNCFIMRREFPQ